MRTIREQMPFCLRSLSKKGIIQRMKHVLRNSFIWLLIVLLLIPAGLVSVADTVLIGDVDGDGEITAQDANAITRHLAGYALLDAAERSRADFDGDGKITSNDAGLIMNALFYADDRPEEDWCVSMIVTADLMGAAWGTDTLDAKSACSALNIATYVQTERERDPGVFLLDAGGSLYGSAIADEYELYTEKSKGPMTNVFARLGYDVVLLGDEALTYPSFRVRNEMDQLMTAGTAVIGTNLIKTMPTLDDPAFTPWNEILPYTILEQERADAEPLRIGVIGLVDPSIAEPTDEVKAADPLESYERIRETLQEQCDLVVLLYHGRTEADESQSGAF
ncbi:MAG: hypothetical protein IKZ82_07020, partial [Clostridia bacterium]|nr:hypothetical protein [Clostridia bacterium]